MIELSLYIGIIAFLILIRLRSRQNLDYVRHELFLLRYRLFNLSMENEGFDFDNPVYKNLESIINSSIRFAHKISIGIFFATFVMMRKKEKSTDEEDLYPKLNEISDSEVQKELSQIIIRHKDILGTYILGKLFPFAIILFILILPFLPFLLIENIMSRLRKIRHKFKEATLRTECFLYENDLENWGKIHKATG